MNFTKLLSFRGGDWTRGFTVYGSELILAMFGIILAIKFFLNVIKEFSYFQLSQFKMNAAYALLRDLTIYIFVLSILIGMVYLNYFDFIHTNLLSLLYGFYIFILIWVWASAILLNTSFIYLKQLFEFETISKDISKLNELKRFYEDLWMENQQIHHLVKDQIQFQLMRQSFIYPVELPILTESFLKREILTFQCI